MSSMQDKTARIVPAPLGIQSLYSLKPFSFSLPYHVQNLLSQADSHVESSLILYFIRIPFLSPLSVNTHLCFFLYFTGFLRIAQNYSIFSRNFYINTLFCSFFDDSFENIKTLDLDLFFSSQITAYI